MNKLDLIEELKTKSNITKLESTQIVQIFFESMANSLIKGERVEVRRFCSFYVKEYKSYIGRNPKTGDKVKIKSKKLPSFKCGKELKERANY